MTSISIQYRVRPVTRYILTRHESSNVAGQQNGSIALSEFDNLTTANKIGEKLSRLDNFDHIGHPDATIGFESLAPVEPKMRCKLRLTGLSPHRDHEGKETGGASVSMSAVWAGSDPEDGGNADRENRVFTNWTPQASFSAWIDNPTTVEMLKQFSMGQDFYVDFTPAPME